MKMVITQQASTKQDILQYLLKQVKRARVSTELDISPQAIRRHLKDLEAEDISSKILSWDGASTARLSTQSPGMIACVGL